MDLRTMREKLDAGLYPDLATMEKDFDLMIANCLAYNNRDTVFYRYVHFFKFFMAVILLIEWKYFKYFVF